MTTEIQVIAPAKATPSNQAASLTRQLAKFESQMVPVPAIPEAIAAQRGTVVDVVVETPEQYAEASRYRAIMTNYIANAEVQKKGLRLFLEQTRPFKLIKYWREQAEKADQFRSLVSARILAFQNAEKKRLREQQAALLLAAQKDAARQAKIEVKAAASHGASKAEQVVIRQEIVSKVQVPQAQPTYQPAPGQYTSVRWHAEITGYTHNSQGQELDEPDDLTCFLELVKAVAAGKAPCAALQPNMTWLNRQAVSLKKEFAIPGCKAESKESLAGGA